jgi:ribosomal protein L12E/L44/L45/RPP1/RPP2
MRALTDEARWEKKAPAQGKILKLLNHGKKSQAFIISSLGSLKDSLNRLKNNNLITEIQVRDMSEEDLQREADVRSGKVTIEQALAEGAVSTSARPADNATPPARSSSRRPAAKKEEKPEPKEEQTSGDLFDYKPTETKLDIDVSSAAKAPPSEAPKPSAAEPKSILPEGEISDIEIENIKRSITGAISESDLGEVKEIIIKNGADDDLAFIGLYSDLLPYLKNYLKFPIPTIVEKRFKAAYRHGDKIAASGKDFYIINELSKKDLSLINKDVALLNDLIKKITGSTIGELIESINESSDSAAQTPDYSEFEGAAEASTTQAEPERQRPSAKYTNLSLTSDDLDSLRSSKADMDGAESLQETAKAAADLVNSILEIAEAAGNNDLAAQAFALSKNLTAQSNNDRLKPSDLTLNIGSPSIVGDRTLADLLYNIDSDQGNLGELIYGRARTPNPGRHPRGHQQVGYGRHSYNRPSYDRPSYDRHSNPGYSTASRARKYYDSDFD